MHIVDGDGGDDGDTRQQMEDGLQSSPVWRLSPGSSSPLVGTRAPHAHTGAALQILYQRCCLAQMNGFDLITIIFYQKHGELRNATGPLLLPAPHSSYRRVLKMI